MLRAGTSLVKAQAKACRTNGSFCHQQSGASSGSTKRLGPGTRAPAASVGRNASGPRQRHSRVRARRSGPLHWWWPFDPTAPIVTMLPESCCASCCPHLLTDGLSPSPTFVSSRTRPRAQLGGRRGYAGLQKRGWVPPLRWVAPGSLISGRSDLGGRPASPVIRATRSFEVGRAHHTGRHS